MSGPRDETVATLVTPAQRSSRRAEPRVFALVVAWSRAEPDRAGEIAIVPETGAGLVLGRGRGEGGDRLRFFRQRPRVLEPTAPLASPGISRRQLLVRAQGDGALVTRVGKCPLEIGGRVHDEIEVREGDVLHLRNELVLVCARRPAEISAVRHFPADAHRRFGRADDFGFVGETPEAWRLREAVAFAAQADTHVLLTGATGTGKELAARAIHALSARASGPFVARNSATLPPGLVDAELFGHAKNYPNAGMPSRSGLVGDAHGGTLFLDEIGELSTELQAHLLRVLDQGGEHQRLGESVTRRSEFRLVAATNRAPSDLKHDLLARLTVHVDLAPLSARRADIPLLGREILLRARARSPAVASRFVDELDQVRWSPDLVVQLLERPLPANTRELEAALWRAMEVSEGDVLDLDGAAPLVTPAVRREEPSAADVKRALDAAGGKIPVAARALGLANRYALYRLLKRYGLRP